MKCKLGYNIAISKWDCIDCSENCILHYLYMNAVKNCLNCCFYYKCVCLIDGENIPDGLLEIKVCNAFNTLIKEVSIRYKRRI